MSDISRRDFLKASGLGVAALGISAILKERELTAWREACPVAARFAAVIYVPVVLNQGE